MNRYLSTLSVAAALTAVVLVPATARGQQQQNDTTHQQHQADGAKPATPGGPSGSGMMPGMMSGRQASARQLNDLVQEMNSAKGPEKVEAMAKLLTALVEDHQRMCGMMDMMSDMPGMKGHGNMGAGAQTPSPK